MAHHPKGLATTPCFQYLCSLLLSALLRFTQGFTACLPPLLLPYPIFPHTYFSTLSSMAPKQPCMQQKFRDQIKNALTIITKLSSLCVYSIYVASFFFFLFITIKQNSNITLLFNLVVVHAINPNPSSFGEY